MRKFLPILIVFVLLISSFCISAATEISLYVNNKKISTDVAPVIVDGRTLVPARALFEPLGAELTWNARKLQATVKMDDITIKLTIDSKTAIVNDESVKLDTAPIIVDNRTLFPVRFVAETLKYKVDWDEKERRVSITAPNKKNKITDLYYSRSGDILTVNVSFAEALKNFSDYYLPSPVRLVLELENCVYETQTLDVAEGGIKSIRMANHDEYFKIVTDLSAESDYDIKLSSNKKRLSLKITIPEKEEVSDPPEEDKKEEEKEEEEDIKDVDIPSTNGIPKNTIVVIDPGHGGSDPGAIAYDEDDEIFAKEKDINLGIAKYVYEILKDAGITTYMTRTDDTYVPLSKRASFANDKKATLFVSIHNNSHEDPDISGILTLYSADKDTASEGEQNSRSVASAIQQEMVEVIGKNSQGIRSEDELYVLRYTEMTAVLAEVLYMSNREDVEYIVKDKHQRLVASAIAKGIIAALKKGV